MIEFGKLFNVWGIGNKRKEGNDEKMKIFVDWVWVKEEWWFY